ncbi:MAG: C4-type zinc ribbon domain-containing protein [Anaerolineales bacterium]|jgi:predicted  nucleic acid-binding Zn-ribbon protein
MSQTFKLYRLQQVDSQLDRIHARLRQIQAAINDDQALKEAHKNLDQATSQLEAQRKILRQAEEQVRQQRLKIEQTESTLYSGKVRNPKELQDLQNEAAALKRYRSTLEDRQLEAMIAVEEAEATGQEREQALEKEQTDFQEKIAELTQEQGNLSSDLARLEVEREATTRSIETSDLALYEQLRKQRRGIAVAKVSDKACSACGSTLNASLLHAARSQSQIVRCDTCGRILYGG